MKTRSMFRKFFIGLLVLSMVMASARVSGGATSFEDDFSTDKGWISSPQP